MNTTTHNKPLGFWLTVAEHRTRAAMRSAFADQGVSRRERRLLTTIAETPVTLDELMAARESRRHGRKQNGACADRAGMKGHRGTRSRHGMSDRHGWRTEHGERPVRRSTSETLDDLVEKGWLTNEAGTFAITEEGARISANLTEQLDSVRAKTRAGISDADYATTIATLQAMAKNLSE